MEGQGCSSIIPLGTMAKAMLARGNTGAAKTEAGAPGDGKAHASSDIAADRGVRLIPLLGKEARELLEDSISLSPDEAISRDNKGNKGAALLEAGSKVLALLGLLQVTKSSSTGFLAVGPGIKV
jgi:hypothetical protein